MKVPGYYALINGWGAKVALLHDATGMYFAVNNLTDFGGNQTAKMCKSLSDHVHASFNTLKKYTALNYARS